MRIIAYIPDLMDKSRFHAVKGHKVFVRSLDELSDAQSGDIAVADLGRAGAIDALAALAGPRRVGYVNHVDDETIETAKAAGIEVFRRSQFFSRIVEILAS